MPKQTEKTVPEAPLTERQELAAMLVAEDALTDEAIAKQVGVAVRTLTNWKKLPAFTARVGQHIDDFLASLRRRGIARVDRRMARLDRDWQKLQRVIADRAAASDGKPGMDTGHVVRTETPVKHGVVIEYRVDTGTLAELRALEMQAAKELGQLVERADITTGGKSLPAGPDLRALTDDQIAALEDILSHAAGDADAAPGPGGTVPA